MSAIGLNSKLAVSQGHRRCKTKTMVFSSRFTHILAGLSVLVTSNSWASSYAYPQQVATGVIQLSERLNNIGAQPSACGLCHRQTAPSISSYSQRRQTPRRTTATQARQEPKVFTLLPPIPAPGSQDPLIVRFRQLAQNAAGLSAQAIQNTIQFMQRHGSRIRNRNFVTIIDYTQPSTSRRMYIFDLRTGRVRRELVAHGQGSGDNFATRFSNRNRSHQTSLGFYLTAETYTGKHGRSMRLDGLEPSNSLARARAIVVHAADYVSDAFVRARGRLGRSWGCPAVARDVLQQVLQTANGSLFYAFGRN